MSTTLPSDSNSAPNLVKLHDGKIVTDSIKIAAVFEKEHSKVLRAIKDLECSYNFIEANFGLNEYTDKIGRKLPRYEMTRDGFTFLAMGFTGAKAAQWKERYIEAFNEMEERLRLPAPQTRHELPFSTQELHSHMEHIRDRLMDVGNALNEAFSVEQLITEKMELNMLAALSIEKSTQREVETKTPDRRVFQQLDEQLVNMRQVVWRELGMDEFLPPEEPAPLKRQQPKALPKPEPRKLPAPVSPDKIPNPFRASPKLHDWFKAWLRLQGTTQAAFCRQHNIPTTSLTSALRGNKRSPQSYRLKTRVKCIVQRMIRDA